MSRQQIKVLFHQKIDDGLRERNEVRVTLARLEVGRFPAYCAFSGRHILHSYLQVEGQDEMNSRMFLPVCSDYDAIRQAIKTYDELLAVHPTLGEAQEAGEEPQS